MSSVLKSTLNSSLTRQLVNNSINKALQRSISTTPTTMSIFRPIFNDPFFSSPLHFGLNPIHVPINERESRQLQNNPYVDLMENFFRPSGLNLNGPAMDLHEESNRYLLTAEIPGVKKEDVQISVDDRLHKLTISGSTKRETTSGGETTQATSHQQDQSSNSTEKENRKSGENETQVQNTNQIQSPEVTSHKNHKPLISERVFGSFSRSFTFPDQADLTKIKAKFQDGLLKMEIPKIQSEKPKVRTVTIEDAGE